MSRPAERVRYMTSQYTHNRVPALTLTFIEVWCNGLTATSRWWYWCDFIETCRYFFSAILTEKWKAKVGIFSQLTYSLSVTECLDSKKKIKCLLAFFLYIWCICSWEYSLICLVFLCHVFSNYQPETLRHWLHLFTFHQLACVDAKSHWLHLLNFSPLCIFKCLHRALA